MAIWNLTPHTVFYDDGKHQHTFPSDGILRLEQIDEPDVPIEGLAIVCTRYGEVKGLPNSICSGDVLIVSTIVGDHWTATDRPRHITVLVPDTGPSCQRDNAGRIVSVCRFIRK